MRVADRIDHIIAIVAQMAQNPLRQNSRTEFFPQFIPDIDQGIARYFQTATANFIPDLIRKGKIFESPAFEIIGYFRLTGSVFTCQSL